MNKHVNAIAGRLSLRPPQRESLQILDRVTEIVPPNKTTQMSSALSIIHSEYATVTDFERDFPSLCFALATGVGKTRLMGAFISYLHLARGINNFFVLGPNLTVYNKLITDFTPNTSKYVFKGIAEFATDIPEIITGDTYDKRGLFEDLYRVRVNIFNISKINSEVRGGNQPRIKRLSEYIGESYFDYLAGLPDLVMLMDESHRYRASAGIRAINELKPILGLELTATPFVEIQRVTTPFKNVIYDYPLARAMSDGFVKEPAVVTQKNFDPKQFTPTQLEELKLQDGVRLHEATKVELETYSRQNNCRLVKPFVLVIARDTGHAKDLSDLIQSDKFFGGRYKDRVLQVDSSQTGKEEEVMIEKLLKVEDPSEPTEIVVHVNMLKEGWDVNNLYTIVPLRPANARVLIEQSIGRGLRLPYGVIPPAQTEMTGIVPKPDIASIVAKATQLIIDKTIDIPRIVIIPIGDVTSGFNPFTLDCSSIHLQPVDRDLLIQHLRTAKQEYLQNIPNQTQELRLEDYIVRSLIDFDDVSYDQDADLLYNLAGQLVKHLKSYLSDEDTANVLQYHQKQLAALIHSQMQLPDNRWEKATGYKASVTKGFSTLKQNAYTVSSTDDIRSFRQTVSDPTNIKRYLFGGFSKCLYESQKFDVDTERRFSVILEDDQDVTKWFKPSRGQFQIYYHRDAAYEPDFVVETKKQLFLCEPKRADQMENPDVVAKKLAAIAWCKHASEHAKINGGKTWNYLLIPHDAIAQNMTVGGLASRYQVS
jgi:superfamily II DNA or RNA helicase